MIALHQRLREGREARGWTQTEAALHLGVSQRRVSQIESGERPSADLLHRFAEIYGLNLEELLLAQVDDPTAADKLTKDESLLISAIRSKDKGRATKLFTNLILA